MYLSRLPAQSGGPWRFRLRVARRNEVGVEVLKGIVSTVRSTEVFGSKEMGFEGRKTVPSKVASIVVAIICLA
jgi:hypothetical protein